MLGRAHTLTRVRHKTAIIGAGIAGLTLARRLTDGGRDVVVFDKSRGVGGRAATRRARGMCIDHGAQYFAARDDGFCKEVSGWEQRGIIERWPTCFDDGEVRYRGVDGMSAVCRALASENYALIEIVVNFPTGFRRFARTEIIQSICEVSYDT